MTVVVGDVECVNPVECREELDSPVVTRAKSCFQRSFAQIFIVVAALILAIGSYFGVAKWTDEREPNLGGVVDDDRSAFNCDNPCAADYKLSVRIRKVDIPGTNATFVARGFCAEDEKTCGMFGPTLKVRPGQLLTIRVKNELNPAETAKIGPRVPVAPDDWLPLMDNVTGRYAGLQSCGFRFVGDPKKPKKLLHDALPDRFDSTNLHLHGLTVEPHLFYPMKTSNPKATMIDIRPGECYCYDFNLHEDQPPGSYWYHSHLHGAVAVQTWSGMAGLLRVEGGLDDELPDKYNVTREEDFVFWDPHVTAIDGTAKEMLEAYKLAHSLNSWDEINTEEARKNHKEVLQERRQLITAKRPVVGVDFFLLAQTDQSKLWYLINGGYQPTYEMTTGEIIRLRVLCATAENLCGFRLLAPDKTEVPFWVIASDGIARKEPVEKKGLVIGGGMREDLLIRFLSPGTYTASSDGLSALQFYCTGPVDATLAAFHVVNAAPIPTIDIAAFRFTYGIHVPIRHSEIQRFRSISFSLQANREYAPFPQFSVNDAVYNMTEIAFTMRGGEAEEWLVYNSDVTMHPFHSHVVPFFITEVKSALLPAGPRLDQLLDVVDTYRDTVVVPAQGFVRLWIRFPSEKAYHGKTVAHCHFLAHEDTGMIVNMMVA
eukprot:GEMP01011366.1.p1 GENE.GEMP01011366.1~~GEMP01011366.1.p1  ORF type:complete len:656 (+),score=147.03 GEMP01011366.1:302-2269(+)